MLALPCCRCCGSVDWGGEGAEGASATGSEEPSLASPAATGAGGARRACPLLTWWPSARVAYPLGGDRRRGAARLLRAAEMRPKKLGGAVARLGRGRRESPAVRVASL